MNVPIGTKNERVDIIADPQNIIPSSQIHQSISQDRTVS